MKVPRAMREIKQETVLKRFYTITATNKKGEKVEWNQDDPVPYNRNEFDFCMDYDDSVIVDDMVFLNQEIIDIYNANKDNFDYIYIDCDHSDWNSYPRMIGVIKETEEEAMQRIENK